MLINVVGLVYWSWSQWLHTRSIPWWIHSYSSRYQGMNFVIDVGAFFYFYHFGPSHFITCISFQIPQKGKIYSVNEGNAKNWDEPTKKYVDRISNVDRISKIMFPFSYSFKIVKYFAFMPLFQICGELQISKRRINSKISEIHWEVLSDPLSTCKTMIALIIAINTKTEALLQFLIIIEC